MRSLFKRLSILAASLATVFGIGLTNKEAQSAEAAEVVCKTLDFATATMPKVSAYTTEWTATSAEGDSYSIANANNNNNGWQYIKMGRKNNASVGSIATSFAISSSISKVVVTVDSVTTSSINSTYLEVSSNADFSNVTTYSTTIASGDTTYTITSPASDLYYRLVFDCASASKNGILQISKVQYYESNATPSISINEDDQVLSSGDSYTFTATTTNANDATVTWTTDTNNYGTIDSTGKFTATANGDVVITASITVDGTTYTDTVNVTVKDVVQPVINTAEISDLISKTANDNTVVQVTGRVSNITNSSYGNFYLLDLNDSSKSILVYGATKDEAKLTLTDSTNGYYTGKFTSSSSNFNNACIEGDIITMNAIFLLYGSTPEIQGVITDVNSIESLSYTGTPTKTTYDVGDTFSSEGLTIKAKYGEDIEIDVTSEVTWSSLASGDTSVTGTFGGKTIEVTGITVSNPTPVYTLKITQDKENIYVDDDGTFTYELKDQYDNAYSGTVSSVSWISSNTEVLDIDNDGMYLAYETGNTTVSLSVVTDDGTYTASLDIEVQVVPTTISDTFNADSLNLTTTYSQTSGNIGSGIGALYTANGMRKDGSSTATQIQMRSSGNNSGIVSTTAKGIIKEITVDWNSGTDSARVLNIYVSNTAFTSPADLYSSSATLIGSLTKGETTLTIPSDEDFAYVGVRSKSGALYLESITFTYEKDADAEDFISMWDEMRTNGTNGICGYLDGSQASTDLDDLLDIYNDFSDGTATKAIINDAEDGADNTISNTIAYVATYRGLNSSSSSYGINSVYNLFDGKNNLAIVLLIGLSGLAAVAAYYFINKKKYC